MILKAVSKIFSLIFLSRITGFVRDMLVAKFLGTSIMSEIFIVASRIPNLFRNFFADGAFNSAFVPIFAAKIEKQGVAKALKFASNAFTILLGVLLIFTLGVEISMPYLLQVFVPGMTHNAENFALLTEISRITFPYLLCLSLVSLIGGVLNSTGHFGISSSMQIWGNMVMILGIFLLPPPIVQTYAHTLGYTFLASGLIQLILIFRAAYVRSLAVGMVKPQVNSDTKNLFKRLIPGIIGSGVYHINIAIDTIFASFSPAAVAYLYYSDRLILLPQGIIAVSITTVLLPLLSKNIATGDKEGATHNQNKALKYAMFATLPCMIWLMALGYYVLSLFFERGAFDTLATTGTFKAMVAYAWAIPAFMLGKIFSSMFYASLDTKTPVKFAGICVLINLVLNWLLMKEFGYVGIAIATTISSWFNAISLGYILHRREILDIKKQTWLNVVKFLLAAIIMLLVSIWARDEFLSSWYSLTLFTKIIYLGTAGTFGGLTYLITNYFLGTFQRS
jgi:putative peptidoglycan lipid II flippase